MNYKKEKPTSFRLSKKAKESLKYLSISMDKSQSDLIEELIFFCSANRATFVAQTTKIGVIPPTPIITHTGAPDSNVFNISKEGLKGGISFFHDENGNEVPLPLSSPELDEKQKETHAKWKAEHEADLIRRGIKL